MSFKLADLRFNTQKIADPAGFARERNAASWLFLCGTEFAAMDGGISYAQVQSAVPVTQNIISDPPRVMDMELARRHVEALDELPRPTLVTCRQGPRSSAVAYMYSGLRAGTEPADVIAAAEAAGAPFTSSDDLKKWVVEAITTLRREGR